MAQSLQGGAFGFLKKSIGSVVYSTSTASLSGQKKQVARSKPTSVRNPRTLSQIVQRMKVGPAQLFYAAFEKAAGSVENNPLSHSWQGVSYGPKSRTKFLQIAMTGDPKAYVPKGIKFAVPGEYQVSEGSLPSLPWRNVTDNPGRLVPLMSGNQTMDSIEVSNLFNFGVQTGDQITFMGLYEDNGVYKPQIARLVVGVGNAWSLLRPELEDDETITGDSGTNVASNLACFAYIVSRGTSSAEAKRSTETLLVTPNYDSLMSAEAYNAAVESYITNTAYNSLNSDWYLNQGSSQAFNGQVFFQSLNLPAIEGLEAETIIALLGRQSDGGSVGYVIFTSDGTSAGTVYARRPGGIATDTAWTASRAAAALGNVNITYAQYTEAIGAQAQGNA